jgi:hypothetical protein
MTAGAAGAFVGTPAEVALIRKVVFSFKKLFLKNLPPLLVLINTVSDYFTPVPGGVGLFVIPVGTACKHFWMRYSVIRKGTVPKLTAFILEFVFSEI